MMNTFTKTFKLTLMLLAFCMASAQNVSASTAYAVLQSHTLTFYYDDDMGSHTGIIFTIDENRTVQAWIDLDQNHVNYYIFKVIFDESFSRYHPKSTAYWFDGLWRLTTIEGIKNLNTDQCTQMYQMFYACYELQSIDLSHFNTVKVRDMERMFYGCRKLTKLNLSSFSSQALVSTDEMFKNCTSLESITFGSQFNMKNVTTMKSMFEECDSMSYLDLTFFDTSSAQNMKRMFWGCDKLETIEVSELWTMDKVEDSTNMFSLCKALTGGSGTKYGPNSADGAYAHIDGGTDNPGYFTKCKDYSLWIGNVRVSKLNKDNIPVQSGSASYDPDADLLLLHNARIEASEGYAIKCGTRKLTIQLAGENRIVTSGSASPLMPGKETYITGDELYIQTKMGMYVEDRLCFNNKFTYVDMDGSTATLFTGLTKNSSDLEFGPETAFMAIGGGNVTRGIASVKLQGHTSYLTGDNAEVKIDSSNGTLMVNGTVATGGLIVGQTYPVWFGSQQMSNALKYVFKLLSGNTPEMFDFAYDADNALVMSGKPGVFDKYNNFISKAPELRIKLDSDWTVTSDYEDTPAMTLYGNTTITGPGKLTVKGKDVGIQFEGSSQLTDRGNLTFEDVDAEVTAGKNGILGTSQKSTLYFNNASATITSTGSGSDGYSLRDYTSLTLNGCAIVNGVTPGNTATTAPTVVISRPTKPYTVLNETGDTLTFYYDNTLRTGTVYDIPTNIVYPGWVLGNIPDGIRAVVFDESFAGARPTTTYSWFMMPRLTTITGIEYLNTSEVTTMWAMFWNARSIEELDLSRFDTSKVKDMNGMFFNCYVLKTIYVGDGWTTSNLSSIPENMFANSTHLVGGAGTTYNTGEHSARWARVDGGTERPGYLTYKSSGLKGDVNQDNKVDISDIVAIINQIAGTASYLNADVNRDNKVDISDIVAVINIIASM